MNQKISGIIKDEQFWNLFPEIKNMEPLTQVAHNVDILQFLSVTAILCPTFVEIDGMVFLEFVSPHENLNRYRKNSKISKQQIEKEINEFSLSDFFTPYDSKQDMYYNIIYDKYDERILKMAEILKHFWSLRLKEIFPNKKFEFLISEDGIYSEDWTCLTFFQE